MHSALYALTLEFSLKFTSFIYRVFTSRLHFSLLTHSPLHFFRRLWLLQLQMAPHAVKILFSFLFCCCVVEWKGMVNGGEAGALFNYRLQLSCVVLCRTNPPNHLTNCTLPQGAASSFSSSSTFGSLSLKIFSSCRGNTQEVLGWGGVLWMLLGHPFRVPILDPVNGLWEPLNNFENFP